MDARCVTPMHGSLTRLGYTLMTEKPMTMVAVEVR